MKIILAKATGVLGEAPIEYYKVSDNTNQIWNMSDARYAIVLKSKETGYEMVKVLGNGDIHSREVDIAGEVITFISNRDFPNEVDNKR